ncbi:hypothetical protein GCM10023338_17180 [Wohlfahrtiimonas larvae]|uniref:DUF3299 domain-containing protein n=2 Tax=Wohlfahrtiimonas larvae TaxID=1157986 RepID=A0ABP9MT56_9GAMM
MLMNSWSLAEDYPTITWDQLLMQSSVDLSHNEISPEALQNYMDAQDQRLPNQALSGKNIAISGFVVPLEWDQASNISEFLLVPYYGACIHVPPPPKNQIIHVKLKEGLAGIQTMDNLTVLGRLNLDGNVSEYGESDYLLVADSIQYDVEQKNQAFIWATLLTLICGLTICIGWFVGICIQQKNKLLMRILLSFSAGTMIYLSLAVLWMQLNVLSVGLWIGGFVALLLLNRILHTQGKLTITALVIHNIPESFIVFSTAMMNIWLGLLLAVTVICHNFPLGCGLVLPESVKSKKQQCYRTLFTGIMPACLAILMYLFLRSILSMEYLIHLSALAGGMMLYVALKEILPKAEPSQYRRSAILGISIAFVVMILLTMLIAIG